jgi:pyruvate,water dikinase
VKWIRFFHEVGLEDVPLVGGKNASLGEMIRELSPLGVRIPPGFATTSQAYWHFLEHNGLKEAIAKELSGLDVEDPKALERASRRLRNLILKGEYPLDLKEEILAAYERLSREAGEEAIPVAVRSSATAEDLPTASFAGQQESYLYVQGEEELLLHAKRAMASLFTARAISYRAHMGFDHLKVALSVGVQRKVRADTGASGVIFTLDPDTGHRGFVYVTAIFGLGENIVQGRVVPDGYYVHKEALRQGFKALVYRRLGAKELTLTYDPREGRLKNRPTPPYLRNQFALKDEEVLLLADWSLKIEDHYSQKRGAPTPMDVEWAKDGPTGELFILQARPETVHSQKSPVLRVYRPLDRGEVLAEGLAVGEAIAQGRARILRNPKEMDRFQEGEAQTAEKQPTNPHPSSFSSPVHPKAQDFTEGGERGKGGKMNPGMPKGAAPKLYLGVHARLVFHKKEDEQAVLDLMRRFSSATRFTYQRLLEGQDRKELKREDGPLCTLFGLNTRYADGAIEKAQATLDSARELGQDPRKVVFGGRKLFEQLI